MAKKKKEKCIQILNVKKNCFFFMICHELHHISTPFQFLFLFFF